MASLLQTDPSAIVTLQGRGLDRPRNLDGRVCSPYTLHLHPTTYTLSSCTLHSSPNTPLSTPCTLHPTPYNPTSYTLHPPTYTPHPRHSNYPLHPKTYHLSLTPDGYVPPTPTPHTLPPYTLHYTLYILHPSPYTLHPTHYTYLLHHKTCHVMLYPGF